MIDYRVPLVDYCKHILGADYPVFDGAMSYMQPQNNYLSYYIVNEQTRSWQNEGTPVLNQSTGQFETEFSPMKTVSLSIDIRGKNSFFDARKLYNSFYEHDNIEYLRTNGLGFMGLDGIASLPHLKEGYNEEGYVFVLHLSFDASYITNVNVIQKITMLSSGGRNCSSSPIVAVDCTNSVGGADGTEYNLAGAWLPTCKMFK